jgi:hypothetical protein
MAELREGRRPTIWGPIITVCIVVIIVIWCCWWWWWRCYPCPGSSAGTTADCDCPTHVEVFITEDCNIKDASGAGFATVYTKPGDIVIWNNDHPDSVVTIDFVDETDTSDTGTPFVHENIVIPPGGQYMTIIRDDATVGTDYDYEFFCGTDGGLIGGPKVNVGG